MFLKISNYFIAVLYKTKEIISHYRTPTMLTGGFRGRVTSIVLYSLL